MQLRSGLLTLAAGLLAMIGLSTPVQAADVFDAACDGVQDSAVCQSKDEGATREEAAGQVRDVINLVLFILGIVAVIMIVYGGFRYVLSSGDQTGIQNAKNTILYAVIGLIVAMMSYARVNFFIFQVQGQ